MSREADHVTWSRVRPRVEREIAERTTELVQAPLEQVLRLQAEIKALGTLADMFDAVAREQRVPTEADDHPTY